MDDNASEFLLHPPTTGVKRRNVSRDSPTSTRDKGAVEIRVSPSQSSGISSEKSYPGPFTKNSLTPRGSTMTGRMSDAQSLRLANVSDAQFPRGGGQPPYATSFPASEKTYHDMMKQLEEEKALNESISLGCSIDKQKILTRYTELRKTLFPISFDSLSDNMMNNSPKKHLYGYTRSFKFHIFTLCFIPYLFVCIIPSLMCHNNKVVQNCFEEGDYLRSPTVSFKPDSLFQPVEQWSHLEKVNDLGRYQSWLSQVVVNSLMMRLSRLTRMAHIIRITQRRVQLIKRNDDLSALGIPDERWAITTLSPDDPYKQNVESTNTFGTVPFVYKADYGYSGHGGFVVWIDIDDTTRTKALFEMLQKSQFFDRQTAGVAVEFFVVNQYTNYLSYVRLITDIGASGLVNNNLFVMCIGDSFNAYKHLWYVVITFCWAASLVGPMYVMRCYFKDLTRASRSDKMMLIFELILQFLLILFSLTVHVITVLSQIFLRNKLDITSKQSTIGEWMNQVVISHDYTIPYQYIVAFDTLIRAFDMFRLQQTLRIYSLAALLLLLFFVVIRDLFAVTSSRSKLLVALLLRLLKLSHGSFLLVVFLNLGLAFIHYTRFGTPFSAYSTYMQSLLTNLAAYFGYMPNSSAVLWNTDGWYMAFFTVFFTISYLVVISSTLSAFINTYQMFQHSIAIAPVQESPSDLGHLRHLVAQLCIPGLYLYSRIRKKTPNAPEDQNVYQLQQYSPSDALYNNGKDIRKGDMSNPYSVSMARENQVLALGDAKNNLVDTKTLHHDVKQAKKRWDWYNPYTPPTTAKTGQEKLKQGIVQDTNPIAHSLTAPVTSSITFLRNLFPCFNSNPKACLAIQQLCRSLVVLTVFFMNWKLFINPSKANRFTESVKIAFLSPTWSDAVKENGVRYHTPNKHFMAIRSPEDIRRWMESCLEPFIHPPFYKQQSNILFKKLSNIKDSYPSLFTPWIAGLSQYSMRLSIYQTSSFSFSGNDLSPKKVPKGLEPLKFQVDENTGAFASYIPSNEEQLKKFISDLITTGTLTATETFRVRLDFPFLDVNEKLFGYLDASINLKTSGAITPKIQVTEVHPMFIADNSQIILEACNIAFYIVYFLFTFVAMYGIYLRYKEETKIRREIHERREPPTEHNFVDSRPNSANENISTPNVSAWDHILVYLLKTSIVDCLQIIIMTYILFLLLSGYINSNGSFTLPIPLENLTELYDALNDAVNFTESLRLSMSWLTFISLFNLALSYGEKRITTFIGRSITLLRRYFLLSVSLLVGFFVGGSLLLFLLGGYTDPQLETVSSALLSCILVPLGQFDFSVVLYMNSILSLCLLFLLWTIFYTSIPYTLISVLMILWHSMEDEQHVEEPTENENTSILQRFFFYIKSLVLAPKSGVNASVNDNCGDNEKKIIKAAIEQEFQRKGATMTLNFKKHSETHKDSGIHLHLDEMNISLKSITHLMTDKEYEALSLSTRIGSSEKALQLIDRFRRTDVLMKVNEKKFSQIEEVLTFVEMWESHLSTEFNEKHQEIERAEEKLKYHLAVYDNTLKEKDSQVSTYISDLETMVEDSEHKIEESQVSTLAERAVDEEQLNEYHLQVECRQLMEKNTLKKGFSISPTIED